MRIISGKARGTNLYTLSGLETRPTLDRVKESIFNIINEYIQDAVVLDLFAGSGAIGLECASRGAKKVVMCDSSRDAINIIKKNIEKTHSEATTEVYNIDFRQIFTKLHNIKFDLIYIDPPYKTDYIKIALQKLLETELLKDETLIIVETDEIERVLKEIDNLNIKIVDQRKYGRANIIFLKKD